MRSKFCQHLIERILKSAKNRSHEKFDVDKSSYVSICCFFHFRYVGLATSND